MSVIFDPSNPVTRSGPLAHQVYDRLADMLLSGMLRPDDRMSIRDLAERFGVSPMPVREAVSRLVARGALEVRPNRAVAVPLLTRAGFRDLTEIRIHNETHAARLAALRMTVPDIDRLHDLERAFRDALTSAEAQDSVRANKALHFHIYRAAGSPMLLDLISVMWLQAGPLIHLDLGQAERRDRNAASAATHAKLTAAIARRDREGAAEALKADIESAADFILSRGVLRH